MRSLSAAIVLLIAFPVCADIKDQGNRLDAYTKGKLYKVFEELKEKTGIKIHFVCGNSMKPQEVSGLTGEDSLVVFYNRSSGNYNYTAGEEVLKSLSGPEIQYILDSELKDGKMGFLSETQKVNSSYMVLSKVIAEKAGLKLDTLKIIPVKPVTSFFYRASNTFPLNVPVRLFYGSPLLFISLFPVVAWGILVKLTLFLWGDGAALIGRFIWRGLIIFVSVLLVIRIGMDYNNIVAAIGAATILFLPVIMIFAAFFKDDVKEGMCRFFGWNED